MPEIKIGRRELYILPTRIGWYYVLILLSLFAIAVKFDNQPAFMMLFILVAVGLVAMVYTHNNVIGLEFSSQASKDIFAGQHAVFPIRLHNTSNKPRSAVWVICGGFHQITDLSENQSKSFELKLPSVQRGYLNCDPIHLSSQYPIGIFFCWTKRFVSEQRSLVYPQPLNLMPFPDDGQNSGTVNAQASIRIGAEDFAGMKNYQAGDRLRDIHWPSLAKTHKLVSIQYENHNSSSINLSWFSLPPHLDQEDKLSQLCYWVVNAEQEGLRYQLEMPNHTLEFDRGRAHYQQCLSVLALWGESPQASSKKPKQKTLTIKPTRRVRKTQQNKAGR